MDQLTATHNIHHHHLIPVSPSSSPQSPYTHPSRHFTHPANILSLTSLITLTSYAFPSATLPPTTPSLSPSTPASRFLPVSLSVIPHSVLCCLSQKHLKPSQIFPSQDPPSLVPLLDRRNVMSGWLSYFTGRTEASNNTSAAKTRNAIVDLRQQLLTMDKQEENFLRKIDEETQKAKLNATSNKRGQS